MMMMALRTMHVRWLLRRRSQLPRQHDPARFVLFAQMFRNLGVERFDITDHAAQEAPRLEVLAGKF